jgi:Flp pilus assembly protein TadG
MALRRGMRAAAWIEGRVSAFVRETKGVAAIEFALILPLMVLTYFGMVVVTTGLSVDRKLTLVARGLADLTSRKSSISDAERDEIFALASEMMQPYGGSQVRMRLSSIVVRQKAGTTDPSQVEGRVCWTETPAGRVPKSENLSAGQTITVPAGFNTANTSYILARVEYDYVPFITQGIMGPKMLDETTPWPVRNVAQVARNGTTCP